MAVDMIARMMAMGSGGGSGDAYTKAETDQLLDGKVDLVDGKIPAAQLPSYVDDVLEYASTSAFPETGESGKIYISTDTNKTYRWGGSAYVEISESLALGETASTAYAGNKGKANADAITAIKDGTNIDSFADVETALAAKLNTADSMKLVCRYFFGETSRTVTYQMTTTDFTNIGNAQLCGMYLVVIIDWSRNPNPSIYIVCYSGGSPANKALTKIVGADAQLTIDEDSVITYTGKGKIQIYALQ